MSADLSIRLSASACPACRIPAALARDTAYCLKCGWNRSAAQRQLLLGAFWSVGFLGVLVFGLTGKLGRFDWTVSAVLLVLGVFSLMNVFTLWRDWKVLRSSKAGDFNEIRFESANTGTQSHEGSLVKGIEKLQRPRPVRFTEDAKSSMWGYGIAGILLGAFFGFAAIRNIDAIRIMENRSLLALMLLSALLLAGVASLLRFRKDKSLVSEGELSIGRVTKQRFLRFKGPHSLVSYEFRTESSEPITGSFQDNSKSLFPGMELIVYYDSKNPRRHVAAPDAIYEPYDRSLGFERIG